jgi:hypothetical protein
MVLLVRAATVVQTQGASGPLGVADDAARKLLVDAVLSEGFRNYQADRIQSDLVATVGRAYARLPASARGPATTVAFKWARTYLSSPAFAAAYVKQREGQRPVDAGNVPSVDDALKKMMDEMWAALEQARQMAAGFPEKERTAFLVTVKEREAELKSPETIKRYRAMLEAERGGNVSSAASEVAAWEAKYPASPDAFVRDHLQRFLTETATLDYSLAVFIVRGPGGEVLGFLSPGYTGMPWQHIHAILAGKDAVDAGRAAAAAWLKELEGK